LDSWTGPGKASAKFTRKSRNAFGFIWRDWDMRALWVFLGIGTTTRGQGQM
jgi:hypothetical protein